MKALTVSIVGLGALGMAIIAIGVLTGVKPDAPAQAPISGTQLTNNHVQTAPNGPLQEQHAEQNPRAAFLAAIAPMQANMVMAEFALTCDLRSEGWLETFKLGYQQFLNVMASRYRTTTNDDLDAADNQANKITADLQKKVTCTSLTNSPTMDQLDLLEDKMSGGYH